MPEENEKDPKERIKELEIKVNTLIKAKAELSAEHDAIQAEHKKLKQSNEALIAQRDQLREDLERVQAERPSLSMEQLGSQLKEALSAIQAKKPQEEASVEYLARTAQFEVKAILDFDQDGKPVFQFPKAEERIDPDKLTTVRIAFDAIGRPEIDLAGLSRVPALLGLTRDGAEAALGQADMTVGQVGEQESMAPPGTVVSQDPEGGSYVAPGTPVDIVVAVQAQTTVPDVIRSRLTEAQRRIETARLETGELTGQVSNEEPRTVLAQDPEAGAQVEIGTAVNLTVAEPPAHVLVPRVVGMRTAEAVATLNRAELERGAIVQQRSDQPSGTVLRQDPKARTRVAPGSKVNLTVSRAVIERTISTPGLVGSKRGEAVRELEEAEWKSSIQAATIDDPTAARDAGRFDTVIAQSPEPGEPVPATERFVLLEVLASPEPTTEVSGIGRRTAERLEKADILTVGDMLFAAPEELMSAAGISEDRAKEFQTEAQDLSEAFHLRAVRGIDHRAAVLLVKGGDVRDPEALARRRPQPLLQRLRKAVAEEVSPEVRGMRLSPGLVTSWIEGAKAFVQRQ